MWLTTTNDRKQLPAILRAAGACEPECVLNSPGFLGAALFAGRGEVLSIKRPIPAGYSLDATVDEALRGGRLLSAVVPALGRTFRPQDTGPFRHKGWVVAWEGDIPHLPRLADAQERDFLQQNARGVTDNERLCNVMLWRLFHLRGRALTAEAIAALVWAVVDEIDVSRFAVTLTREDLGVVVARGIPVVYRVVKGGHVARPGVVLEAPHVRANVVVTGMEPTAPGWERLLDGKCLEIGEIPPIRVF